VIKSLKLPAANFVGYLLCIVYSAVIHVNLHALRVPVSNAVIAPSLIPSSIALMKYSLLYFRPPGKYTSLINRLPVTNMVIIDFFDAIVRDTLGTISDRSSANIAED
jgi:hypothetical protein